MFANYIGPVLTILAASIAATFPGIGSARGVGGVGQAASGVLTEDPDKFGKLLVLQALPGTQGIYGLLSWFMIMNQSGMLSGNFDVSWQAGALFFMAALPITIVGYGSAIHQGKVCEGGVALVGKRPDQQSKPLIMAAMVETYAILALLATILAVLNINPTM